MKPRKWLSFKKKIVTFFHCLQCLEEKPSNLSPREFASLDVGLTDIGLQVWCKRHNCNVISIDFEGIRHPFTPIAGFPGRGGTAIIVESEESKEKGFWVAMRNNCGGSNGVYGCPGGSLEGDEDWMDGACRELLEETGLKRTELLFLDVSEHQGIKTDWTAWFYTKLEAGETLKNLEPEKHGEWIWMPFKNVDKEPLFLTTSSMVKALVSENL